MDIKIREVQQHDLAQCAATYAVVFTEWPYQESWTQAQALSDTRQQSARPLSG
jgi:hypothetical protein